MYTERDVSNPLASWVLTDVADNTTRGSFERITEKMSKMSAQSHKFEKMKQDLEKALKEPERRSHRSEATRMDAEQNRLEAEKSRQETERSWHGARRIEQESENDKAKAKIKRSNKVEEIEERFQGTEKQLPFVKQQLHEAQEKAARSAREAENARQEVRLLQQRAEQRGHDKKKKKCWFKNKL